MQSSSLVFLRGGVSSMSKMVVSRGFNIYCEVHGDSSSKQTLIFCHGNGNCVNDWKTLGYVAKLAPHFRLILVDALGYGMSDKPLDSAQYTSDRRAEDVVAVLDAFGVEKAHFFGSSIGGSVGFVLADLYPNRFFSFSIGCAHPYGSTQPVGCNLFGKEFQELLARDGIEGFVKEVEEKYLGRPFCEGVREQYLKNDAAAMIAANTPVWPDRSYCLEKISVPVLLFAGDKDPVSSHQYEIAGRIRDCEVHILPDTDHADTYWNSCKTAPIVRDFLLKHFDTGISFNPFAYAVENKGYKSAGNSSEAQNP